MSYIKYLLLDKKNYVVLSTIEDEKKGIIDFIHDKNKLIEYLGKKYRTGKVESSNGTLYAYTYDKKLIRSSRSFTTHLNVILDLTENLNIFKKEVKNEIYKHVNILIHNLMTINAHSMQEIFNFIPQDELSSNTKGARKIISDKISNNNSKAALVLLKLLKNNLATKTEFSVFSKLYEENPSLNKKNYDVSTVLLNILYNFFPDITDKEIELDISESPHKAFFDYESIQVALFHMIDNTVKYIKPNTKLTIRYEELNNQIDIIFDMISLKVSPDEIEKIFIEGFSGQYAVNCNKSGKGIGMSRVKQIIELNNGEITLSVVDNYKSDTSEYNNNIFKISLKKEGF